MIPYLSVEVPVDGYGATPMQFMLRDIRTLFSDCRMLYQCKDRKLLHSLINFRVRSNVFAVILLVRNGCCHSLDGVQPSDERAYRCRIY
jgi:hypothetical protein